VIKSDLMPGRFLNAQSGYSSNGNKKFLSVSEIEKLLVDNNL